MWTYIGQVGKNLCRDKMVFWSLHVQGNSEAIVVYGGDRKMAWCEVMVQRVKDAGGDGRARVGACRDQRRMMRVEATEVRFGGYDT